MTDRHGDTHGMRGTVHQSYVYPSTHTRVIIGGVVLAVLRLGIAAHNAARQTVVNTYTSSQNATLLAFTL